MEINASGICFTEQSLRKKKKKKKKKKKTKKKQKKTKTKTKRRTIAKRIAIGHLRVRHAQAISLEGSYLFAFHHFENGFQTIPLLHSIFRHSSTMLPKEHLKSKGNESRINNH
jgi:hypothetical protein